MGEERVIDPETGEEKVVKTEEEISEEETTPPKEEEEKPPASEGVKPEVLYDEFGVPLQNRTKEFERKNLELQAKIRELQEKGKQEEADDLETFLKERKDPDLPLTNEEIKKLTNAIGKRVTDSVARTIGPVMASQRVIEAQVGRLKRQEGFDPKAESLLRSNLNEVPPEVLVGNPEVIANKIYAMTLGELVQSGKIGSKPKLPKKTPAPGAPVIESPGTPPARRGQKPFTEHEKAEAERMNISPQNYRDIQERRAKKKKEREGK